MKENYDIGTTNFTTRSLQTNVTLQHVSYFKEKPMSHILSLSCMRS